MSRSSSSSLSVRGSVRGVGALLALIGMIGVPLALSAGPAAATPPVSDATTYVPGTPQVATIANGSSQAPWNTSQGDPATAAYQSSDLLPTYTPGGNTTTIGGVTEPNVAVYPGSGSGTSGAAPYPSGVVGTPGPLDGYCGTGNYSTEAAGSPVRQTPGSTLPFSPDYFPHVVRNADGSLTGYFDYRPKDADEAIIAARSTDNGTSWTYEGEALEEDATYCPAADINDDGEGHPNVITVGNSSYLYTLQRPAGDYAGVGLLVHQVNPAAANPLAGLPASEQVGVDPDAFATATTPVPASGGMPATINLNQTGAANSPEQLVPGPFVDLSQTPTPTASSIINCTAVGTTTLSGCTSAASGGITVNSGDLIEQVIGTVSSAETIPKGPNNTVGTSGTKKNLPINFTDNLTATILNINAPNRVYVNGVAVYCPQANASPTTTLEYCTTGPKGSPLSVAVGAPVTADPVVPATAQQTNGLVAPDGIVGVLPSYPGAPAHSTVVMYTEKLLNYYEAGITSASAGGTFSSTTGSSIQFYASPTTSSSLPTPTPSQPVTVEMGDDTNSAVIPVTCTGLTVGTGTITSSSPLIDTLTGCTVPAADNGGAYASNDQIAAPNATLESPSTLAKTGEGSTNQDKLYKNNEDFTLLRVAYTTDGINFSTTGLDNNGIISGQSDGSSAYTDINNPLTTADPPGGLNQYAAAGTTDATEMRWVGSSGSIITNPDGSYGLFLSGSWSADGDSDAFNQIFYSSSTDGEHWTEPVSVISTDYTFSASVAQDNALAHGADAPLGISAYYSGRAYGPSVVPNANGTLTMVFSGYRSPKPIINAGTVMGTNPSAQWTVGATDPALYRNILAVTLDPSTSPAVTSQTSVSASPPDPVTGQPVTYTASVSVPAPGSGTPTGSVTFVGGAGTLCSDAPLSVLSPDTATCTTTYSGGAQSDTVTASYSGDSNYAPSSGSTTVAIGSPLALTKSTTSTGYGKAGDTIPYSYLVTNSGPDSLSSVGVTDSLVPNVSCPDPTLAAGGSETCNGTYTVSQADVDAGSVTNTATVSALDGPTYVASNTSSVNVEASNATSSLSLTKSTSSPGYGAVGQTIPYSYLVTNTGTTTLADVSVSDNLVADVNCPASSLAPAAQETCNGTYTVSQADVDAGSVTNTATASATAPDDGGTVTSDTSSVTVDASSASTSLTLDKTADTSGYSAVGDTVGYQYVVTNTGTTTLSDVSVSDNRVAGVTCPPGSLAPGDQETCSGTYTVTQADINAGTVTNTATATADGPQGGSVSSNSSSATVTYGPLTLTKSTTSAGYGKSGDTIPYSYTVTNGNPVTLTDVSDTDSLIPDVSCPSSSLAGGASETCTGTYTVTQADVDAGSVTNSASATGTDGDGNTVTSGTASVTVLASQATSSLSLTKATTSTGYGRAGQTIPYSYLVTNTGTTTLAEVGVADSLIMPVSCPDASLAPSQSETCTAIYTVTQADVDAGSVTNQATASAAAPDATTVDSNSSSVTVAASSATSSLSLVKTSSSRNYTQAGQAIPYSYRVTNTGTTTLSDVGVTDDLVPAVGCPVATHGVLTPGAAETCTGTYTVTQEDVDNGSLTNTATANATNPQEVAEASAISSVTLPYVGLKITTTSLPTLTLGQSYNVTLAASGAVAGGPPLKWGAESGLPKGLKLSASGLLHGTVSAKKVVPGTYDLTIQVTQSNRGNPLKDIAFISLQVVS